MNQLDGAVDNEDVIVIATTNRVEVVEQALRNRPSRFDRVVSFGTINDNCRRQMLEQKFSEVSLSEADLRYAISATDGLTGAQIEEFVNTVFLHALQSENSGCTNTSCAEKPVRLSRSILDAALAELQGSKNVRVGYQTAG